MSAEFKAMSKTLDDLTVHLATISAQVDADDNATTSRIQTLQVSLEDSFFAIGNSSAAEEAEQHDFLSDLYSSGKDDIITTWDARTEYIAHYSELFSGVDMATMLTNMTAVLRTMSRLDLSVCAQPNPN
jgi:hypothetical protein